MTLPDMPTQADADQFHATGREAFNALVDGMPPIINAGLQTHATAIGIWMCTQLRQPDPGLGQVVDAIDALLPALAYAAVTERARRDGGYAPNLADYLASEGGEI